MKKGARWPDVALSRASGPGAKSIALSRACPVRLEGSRPDIASGLVAGRHIA
jgi:hypothetical protein